MHPVVSLSDWGSPPVPLSPWCQGLFDAIRLPHGKFLASLAEVFVRPGAESPYFWRAAL